MSENVQERFEDYLELEQYTEQLRLQKSARLPANLAPQQTGIYGMALLFHTASPQVADPRPEFKEQLRQHLLAQLRADEQTPEQKGQETVRERGVNPLTPTNSPVGTGPDKPLHALVGANGANPAPTAPPQEPRQFRNLYSHEQASPLAQPPSPHPESGDAKQHKKRGVSRRTIFRSGTIAASLLATAGIGAGVEHALESRPAPDPHPTLVETAPGTWHWQRVASLKQLGNEPVSFTTGPITGYLIRQENTSDEQIIALSAACTHLGCPVQWQEDTRQFLCPCHTRIFDDQGGPVQSAKGLPHHTSLARLETKTDNGNIYVKVPQSSL